MAWPPGLPSTGFKSEGDSNYVWGTVGFAAASGMVTNYIIKSVRSSERVEPIEIMNGTGLTSTQILLLDGVNTEITVIDNTAVTPPIAGSVGTIVLPLLGVNGVINNAAINFEVVETSVNLAQKQPGERVISGKSFVLFTPS